MRIVRTPARRGGREAEGGCWLEVALQIQGLGSKKKQEETEPVAH